MSGTVTVLFFSAAREVTGHDEFLLPCPETGFSEDTFWKELLVVFPGLREFRSSMRLAKNHEYLQGGGTILSGDEVALIPPVSGG